MMRIRSDIGFARASRTARCAIRSGAIALLAATSTSMLSWRGQDVHGLPTAVEVVRRHIEAVGGLDAVLQVQSRYVWGTYEDLAHRRHGTIQIYAARPNKRVVKTSIRDVGTTVTGFDGTAGWVADPGKAPRSMVGSELAELRDESEFDIISPGRDSLLRSIVTLETAPFEGRPCYRLRVESKTRRTWSEYFDVATGLFAGSQVQHAAGKDSITVKFIVSDYRRVDGVRFPYQFVRRSAASEEIVKVEAVKNNSVSPSEFELPRRLRP